MMKVIGVDVLNEMGRERVGDKVEKICSER